jgi:hypothetical protein
LRNFGKIAWSLFNLEVAYKFCKKFPLQTFFAHHVRKLWNRIFSLIFIYYFPLEGGFQRQHGTVDGKPFAIKILM